MMLIIWEYRTRGFDDLIIDLSKKMLFWLFLTAFAFNANNYIHIANVIYNAPSEVAGWFLKGTAPIDNNFFEQAPISLDQLLNLINRFYDSLDWTKVGQIFRVSIAYDLINIVGHGFISITFGSYMICRVLLAVTIMIGPIFISFLFFPATRQWGINWIGQILSYLITAVLYMITIVLFINFLKGEFEAFIFKFTHPDIPSVVALLDGLFSFMFGLTLIFLLVLWRIPTIASSPVGGASSEGMFSGGLKAISVSKAIVKVLPKEYVAAFRDREQKAV